MNRLKNYLVTLLFVASGALSATEIDFRKFMLQNGKLGKTETLGTLSDEDIKLFGRFCGALRNALEDNSSGKEVSCKDLVIESLKWDMLSKEMPSYTIRSVTYDDVAALELLTKAVEKKIQEQYPPAMFAGKHTSKSWSNVTVNGYEYGVNTPTNVTFDRCDHGCNTPSKDLLLNTIGFALAEAEKKARATKKEVKPKTKSDRAITFVRKHKNKIRIALIGATLAAVYKNRQGIEVTAQFALLQLSRLHEHAPVGFVALSSLWLTKKFIPYIE